jgi:hypothetical protein
MPEQTATLVYEYTKSGESPGPVEQCGGSWHFFVSPTCGPPSVTLTETDWVALGKPEKITMTIENGDD